MQTTLHRDHARVWRVELSLRICYVLVALACSGLPLVIGITPGDTTSGGVLATLWAFAAVVWVGCWRWGFVPRVVLEPSCLTVYNRISHRSVPYGEIDDLRPGYNGLLIRLKSGGWITAWAVQQPNLNKWTHTRGRSDELIDLINARRAHP